MKRLLATVFLGLVLLAGLHVVSEGQWRYPLYPFRTAVTFNKEAIFREQTTAPALKTGYGKLYVMAADGLLYFKADDGTAYNLTTGGGSSTFVGLSDTPGNFTGDSLKLLVVNVGETAVEFSSVLTQTADGIEIDAGGTGVNILRLYDDDTNYVDVKSQEMASNWSLTLPADDGDNGQVLTTNGSGVTDWTAAGGGSGDVVGPASATDNAICRFDTTTGKLIQDTSNVTIDDNGYVTGVRFYVGGASYMIYQTSNRIRISGDDGVEFRQSTDLASDHAFKFYGDAGDELNGSSGVQPYFHIYGQINQTSTAGYTGMKVEMLETSLGSGTNLLLDLLAHATSPVTQFAVEHDGKIWTNQGTANTNTPSGATAYALAIYDSSGSLLGYIPVYAAQW